MRETKEAKEIRERVEARQRAELKKREAVFLIGLEKLSRETGFVINSYGHCSLEEVDMSMQHDSAGYVDNDDGVSWLSSDDGHYWDINKHAIAKPDKEQS